MKKNVLSLSIQAMFVQHSPTSPVHTTIDYGSAGHALVVPFFENESSPLLTVLLESHDYKTLPQMG